MAEQSVIRAAGATVPEKDVRRPRGSVEGPLAEVGRDWERPLGSHPLDPVTAADATVAKGDILVPVDTGGAGQSYVFVAAGDRLPTRAELGNEPVPAQASPLYRAKPGKPAA